MTVQWWWFQTHTAQKAEHISKGSVLALSSGGWSLKRLFLYGSAALVPCLPDLFANALYNHLPHQVKWERHYKVYTRINAYNLASALALRAAMMYFKRHLVTNLWWYRCMVSPSEYLMNHSGVLAFLWSSNVGKKYTMAGSLSGAELPDVQVLKQLARDQLILQLEAV